MRMVFALVLMFSLSACASLGDQSAGPGQAVYHYAKTKDTCTMTITSAKDVEGIEAMIDKNCAVEITAGSVSGMEAQIKMMNSIDNLIQRFGP